MNLSTVILFILAWQMLSSSDSREKPKHKPNLTDLFSDDAKNIIDCVEKLSGNGSGEDKMGAILQMASNPAVMDIVQDIFSKKENQNGAKSDNFEKTKKTADDNDSLINNEGYKFETPSRESREFFRPIDNIADAEVKHKLYKFYDNWYVS